MGHISTFRFDARRPLPELALVGCHSEGEVGDVIVGGIEEVAGTTMFEKLKSFEKTHDSVRQLLLNEPRGRASLNLNVVLPPCDPQADVGIITMSNDAYAFMSGSNAICATTVLLETGAVRMVEPETRLILDTPAGLVPVVAQCDAGKCKSVAFDNVPAFVEKLDLPVDVPGIGRIPVDIAWGGMWYGIVAAESLGVSVSNQSATELIELGDLVTKSIQAQFTPVHPENAQMAGVCTVSITEAVESQPGFVTAKHTTIIPPSRCDRSPCGTGTSARMAVLHARGILKPGDVFRHRSIIGTEFVCRIKQTTKVCGYDAIIPNISGRAWITGYKQMVLDPTDPYPEGFRVGDQWPMASL